MNWSVRRRRKNWTKYWCQVLELECSAISISILLDNFCRIFLSPRLSIFANDTILESPWKITSNLMSVSILSSQRISPYSLQCLRYESLPTSPLRICLSRSRSSSMSEFHRQIKSWSWSRLRNGLDDKWPLHPELDRSLCFHESILSLGMTYHFEVMCALDMNLWVCQVLHHQVS